MPQPYLVVDLEATCDRTGFPVEQSEIVEIGAVLVDPGTLAPAGEFQTFVRPLLHPTLTAFCTELTSIRQQDVDTAPMFPEAIAALTAWLPGPVLLASWGAYDRNQLSRDRHRHGIRLPFGKGHLNIKAAFAERAGRRPMGMAQALQLCGLPLEGTHHRGIDDARNIAKLLPYAIGRVPIGAGR
jgi:inhibitor of KinA sporulation pathway (predicted exonuclease)